ncbi:MAG: coproporphyrinogen III oxidase, partial [Ghiorsea sp.]
GILGSLPAYVNRDLLQSWVGNMPAPQDKLLQGLIDVLPTSTPALVDAKTKEKLAQVVRSHYQQHPEAITMQASGDNIPPTVKNHR